MSMSTVQCKYIKGGLSSQNISLYCEYKSGIRESSPLSYGVNTDGDSSFKPLCVKHKQSPQTPALLISDQYDYKRGALFTQQGWYNNARCSYLGRTVMLQSQ